MLFGFGSFTEFFQFFIGKVKTFCAFKHQIGKFGLCKNAAHWGAQQVHGAETTLYYSCAVWDDANQLDKLKQNGETHLQKLVNSKCC